MSDDKLLKEIIGIFTKKNINNIYLGEGIFYDVDFKLFAPTKQREIKSFLENTSFNLPEEYIKFLLLHNGGIIYFNTSSGGGIELLPLEEIMVQYDEYQINHPDWFPIAYTYAGHICIDSRAVLEGEKDYMVWKHSIDTVDEAVRLNCSFIAWLENLIKAQGHPYWLWR